jgi:hypothetical protein
VRSLFGPRALPCAQVCVFCFIVVAASFTSAGLGLRGGHVLQIFLADQHAINVTNIDAVAVQASTASARCAASTRPRLTALPSWCLARCVLGLQRIRFVCSSLCPQFSACVSPSGSLIISMSQPQQLRSLLTHAVCHQQPVASPTTCLPALGACHSPPHKQLLTSITGRASLHSPVISLSITCVLAACITLLSWANHPPATALGNIHAHSTHEGSCHRHSLPS